MMKLIKLIIIIIIIIITVVVYLKIYSPYYLNSISPNSINIAYQAATAQTWSAIIIKDKNLIQKYFPRKIEVHWHNYSSGAPIISSMQSNKIDIGFMGDMPLIIAKEKGMTFLAFDGKNPSGTNQGILVKSDSLIHSYADLTSRSIAVPVISSTHRMILGSLEKVNLDETSLTLLYQDITTALNLLEKGGIDAVGLWEPYITYGLFTGKMRLLPNVETTPYLAGVMINKTSITEQNVSNAFLLALNEAHTLLKTPDESIIDVISRESGFDKNIVKEVLKKTIWESRVDETDFTTIDKNIKFLIKYNKISSNNSVKSFFDTGKYDQAR